MEESAHIKFFAAYDVWYGEDNMHKSFLKDWNVQMLLNWDM